MIPSDSNFELVVMVIEGIGQLLCRRAEGGVDRKTSHGNDRSTNGDRKRQCRSIHCNLGLKVNNSIVTNGYPVFRNTSPTVIPAPRLL